MDSVPYPAYRFTRAFSHTFLEIYWRKSDGHGQSTVKLTFSRQVVSSTQSIAVAVLMVVAAPGCGSGFRGRMGALPTPTIGTAWEDQQTLGKHAFGFTLAREGNGIAYTRNAGHVDLAHIRIWADFTRVVMERTYVAVMKDKRRVRFNLPTDPSIHIIELEYPQDWPERTVAQKEQAATDISMAVAPYVAYCAGTWHEILTWHHYHSAIAFPEEPSAFSWEDGYSNALGVKIGMAALADEQHDYDEAMTLAIERELDRLGVQHRDVSKEASLKVKGKWFTGELLAQVSKRNFDIGEDGYITPTLVLQLVDGAEPEPIAVPMIDQVRQRLAGHGFGLHHEIDSRVWETNTIMKKLPQKVARIKPDEHFPVIMAGIRQEAISRGYTDCDN